MPIIKTLMSRGSNNQRRLIDPVPRKSKILLFLIGSLLALISFALAAPSTFRITIGTFAPYYSPTYVSIYTGTPISWANPTAALHSITHDDCQNGAQCAFDSGPLGPNNSFTLYQLSPGSYSYHCSFHPIMRGVLVVQDTESPNET